jgi:hypothetical protein
LRGDAVLALLHGCNIDEVARAYSTSASKLQDWRSSFVAAGMMGLLTPRAVDPSEVAAAFRGTWVLRSRVAGGHRAAQAEGLMIYSDTDSLVVETGVLDQAFADAPLGPQEGQPFRLGQYARLFHDRRPGASASYRITSGELVGSFSDYPHGIRMTQTDLFVRVGDAIARRLTPGRTYSPDHSDQLLVMGDSMLITWTKMDVVDTWERISHDPPALRRGGSLAATWANLKASGALLERSAVRPTELVAADLPAAASGPRRPVSGAPGPTTPRPAPARP